MTLTFIKPTDESPPKREQFLPWTKENEASLIEMFRTGFSTLYMAQQLGVTRRSVQAKMSRMGLNYGHKDKRFPWTADDESRLRQLRDAGDSASTIASKLGRGLSRSAVMGKCSRMGLLRATKPRTNSQAGIDSGIKRRMAVKSEMPAIESDGRINLPPDQSLDAISLIAAQDHQCRWPLTDTDGGFLFCGSLKHKAYVYCLRHARLAYKGAQS